MNPIVKNTAGALCLVGIGVGAGWAARTGAAPPGKEEPPGSLEFDARTLENLGVEVGVATLSRFVEQRLVQAVIEDAPLNRRPLTAPLAGVVRSVDAGPGAVLAAGAPVATMMRDAIPRPRLELTAGMFTPVSESLHDAFAEMKSAVNQVRLLDAELSRIRGINARAGAPVVPRQTEVDLENQLDAARQRQANSRSELEHHGLSEVEIESVAKGGHPPRGRELWQRALTVHGLWTPAVQELFAALPEATRSLPWSVATLGELSAAGMVDGSLVAAVKASPVLRDHFAEAAGLLQQGQSVARLLALAELGALQSVFPLSAPGDAPDWDLVEVVVRPGQSVAAGDAVAVVRDPRRMWLRLRPLGDEIPLVMGALKAGTRLTARPLLAGVGPELADLQIRRVESGEHGDSAILECANQPAPGAVAGSRTWQLRPGMRYAVRIPGREHDKVFVFEKGGVGKEGSTRVVYVRNGKSFAPRVVRVVYEDEESVVVKYDGPLSPGDDVVTRGAFVIGTALQQGSGGGGGHHGHTH